MGSENGQKAGVLLERLMMAPNDAPSWVKNPEIFWTRVGDAEKRCDALEAWVFDFQWPREFPFHLFREVVEGVYGQFRDQGLVVQIDFENEPAADRGDNPHIHAMISTRPIDGDGFANKKNRRINTFFRLAGGYGPRFHLADVLNAVAALHGISVRFDGHSNAWRNLPPGEDRLPLHVKRNPETPSAQKLLAKLNAQRCARGEFDAVVDQIAENEMVDISIARQLEIEKDAQVAFRKRVGDSSGTRWIFLQGTEPRPIPCLEGSALAYATGSDGAYVWNDDDAIRIDGEIAFDRSCLVSRVAWAHGLQGFDEGSNFSDCYKVSSEPDPHWHTPTAVRRVSSIISDIFKEPQWKEKLQSWRDALVEDGSSCLATIVDDLGGLRSLGFPVPHSSDITAIVGDRQRDDLWARYRLCVEADMSDLPFSRAGRVLVRYSQKERSAENSPQQALELSASHRTIPPKLLEVELDVETNETGERSSTGP
ncbi:MobA/MobL family protein [Aurantimonas sp. A2-1-M11]|uniref:MobA/MobL family protein n=1 Tax=Aurantimonas sp. A2-1-M11 TaxID=3113712 RepID=UPI002F9469C4